MQTWSSKFLNSVVEYLHVRLPQYWDGMSFENLEVVCEQLTQVPSLLFAWLHVWFRFAKSWCHSFYFLFFILIHLVEVNSKYSILCSNFTYSLWNAKINNYSKPYTSTFCMLSLKLFHFVFVIISPSEFEQ